MDSKKVGLIFIFIGISVISLILVYPRLREKTEMSVPVLKSFSDSSISENIGTENVVPQSSAAREETTYRSAAENPVPAYETQTETVFAVTFPIDINAATVEELMQIKDIGRTVAENIVSYRENFGYFYSMEDLLKVEEIGAKRFDILKAHVYISRELQSEISAQETAATTETSYRTVTTVPKEHLQTREEQTSVVITVPPDSETEDSDGGRIIEEITDFEDVDQTLDQSDDSQYENADNSFSYFKTTTEKYYPNFPLELNTASAKDLAFIKGIGDTIAERIVAYARSHGFYEVNDLLNVNGISQGKLNDIAPYVYVDASGLPPKPETAASSFYDDFSEPSYDFPNETEIPAVSSLPEIHRVNVNTASKADFMQLPGIDEELADNIISLRNSIGGFAAIEELSLADGMTNSRLSAIWNYIYV